MRDAETEIVRASITSTQQCAKLPRYSNISKEKLIAQKTLANDSIVTVVPTDKGLALVVIDNKEYNDKIEDLIQNTGILVRISAIEIPGGDRSLVIKVIFKPKIFM